MNEKINASFTFCCVYSGNHMFGVGGGMSFSQMGQILWSNSAFIFLISQSM